MRRAAGGRWLAIALAVAVAGCAGVGGGRIERGVYHSAKGYRVTLPGPGWAPGDRADADLSLRDAVSGAGMLVNASCDARAAARPAAVLARHLLIGLARRQVSEAGPVTVNGRQAAHELLDASVDGGGAPVRIELYVMKDERCVYDLVYVAPPASFAAERPAFQRLVESFATD